MWLTVVGEAVAPESAFAFVLSTDVKFKVDQVVRPLPNSCFLVKADSYKVQRECCYV